MEYRVFLERPLIDYMTVLIEASSPEEAQRLAEEDPYSYTCEDEGFADGDEAGWKSVGVEVNGD